MYCLNMLRIALELAQDDPVYEDIATKFFEHFLYIAEAMTDIGASGIGLWDEDDGFYYDVLQLPDGSSMRDARCARMVGLIPLFAVDGGRAATSSLDLPASADALRMVPRATPRSCATLVSRWPSRA